MHRRSVWAILARLYYRSVCEAYTQKKRRKMARTNEHFTAEPDFYSLHYFCEEEKDGRIKSRVSFFYIYPFPCFSFPPHSITLLFFPLFPGRPSGLGWHLKDMAECYRISLLSLIHAMPFQDILIDGGLVTVWIIFYWKEGRPERFILPKNYSSLKKKKRRASHYRI